MTFLNTVVKSGWGCRDVKWIGDSGSLVREVLVSGGLRLPGAGVRFLRRGSRRDFRDLGRIGVIRSRRAASGGWHFGRTGGMLEAGHAGRAGVVPGVAWAAPAGVGGGGSGAGGGSISTGGLALRVAMRRVAVSAKALSGEIRFDPVVGGLGLFQVTGDFGDVAEANQGVGSDVAGLGSPMISWKILVGVGGSCPGP